MRQQRGRNAGPIVAHAQNQFLVLAIAKISSVTLVPLGSPEEGPQLSGRTAADR
jgi:hypothetical protein